MRNFVIPILFASAGVAGCAGGPDDATVCLFETEAVVAPSDDALGFSAEDVVAQLGSRRFRATYHDAYLEPSFDELKVTWTLADEDVLRGTQSTSCQAPSEGLAVPVSITVASDDASVSVSRDLYLFAAGVEDTDLWEAAGPQIDGEGSAVVPEDYLAYAVDQAGGTLTGATPAVVVVGVPVVAPQIGLQYRGVGSEGEMVVPVFEAALTPL